MPSRRQRTGLNNHAEALLTNGASARRVFTTEPELTHFRQTKGCQHFCLAVLIWLKASSYQQKKVEDPGAVAILINKAQKEFLTMSNESSTDLYEAQEVESPGEPQRVFVMFP